MAQITLVTAADYEKQQ